MTLFRNLFFPALCFALAISANGQSALADAQLIQNGQAQSVIVAPPGSLKWEGDTKKLNRFSPWSEEPERRKRLLRDSINDLALYLGKMSGAKIDIVESTLPDDKRVPIYIGEAAQKVFGPVGKTMAGLYAFRVVSNAKGIGLYGESEHGISYAIYELLHRLGCRWYMPSEMGETYPSTPSISVPEMDEKLAPVTEWRKFEVRTADDDFRRRNRMGDTLTGGNIVKANHILENYITDEQRAAHPEWKLVVKGEPHPKLLRWTRQDVADAIGDAIIAQLDKRYSPSVSLSPGDYVVPTDDPEEMKADPTPRVWEPAANQWSVTDRLILLCNRVAERVNKKYPDVRFGVLVYVNYSMPPARYKINPNVIPVLAPIDFNRAHPMTWKEHPDGSLLLDMLQGWAKVAPRLVYRGYGMNLAEITAPNPFITKWGTDIPLLLENNVKFWGPETMGGWESMMPGYYLAIRMTFDPNEKPDAILSDMWPRLYGGAAEPMSRYWHRMDKAWLNANEFAGAGYGYLKIFTPDVMKGARADINEALKKAKTPMEQNRVKMIDESLKQFELFMKMQHDWANGRIAGLGSDLEIWRNSLKRLRADYKPQYSFDSGLAQNYVTRFWGAAFDDATRMSQEYSPLGAPLLQWKYQFDKEKQAEEQGWTKPDFNDADWKTMQVVSDTWSDLGHYSDMGRMVYRATVNLDALPAGKKAYLWIGSFSNSAKLFVNGQHVKYVVPKKTRQNEAGDVIDAPNSFATPASFDVTNVIKPGANQITILVERNWLNEVGVGGLMGPVVVFREK